MSNQMKQVPEYESQSNYMTRNKSALYFSQRDGSAGRKTIDSLNKPKDQKLTIDYFMNTGKN